MGNLLAISSENFITPDSGLNGLSVMSEEYDSNSVTGILLKDLGGPFKELKEFPVLSGVFTNEGLKKLDIFMLEIGFMTKYKVSFNLSESSDTKIPERDVYLIRVYDYPYDWDSISNIERDSKLMELRFKLKKMGEEKKDMTVFSFWPDVIMIKEILPPLKMIEHFDLNRDEFLAKTMMLYVDETNGSNNDLYSFNPSFLQGYASMNNGENNRYKKNKDFLSSRKVKEYNGCTSCSDIFTQILHYSISVLGMNIKNLKHVITPLSEKDLSEHKDGNFLTGLKHSCRDIAVHGAYCMVGTLPDNTLFMTQDSKSISTGVVGGQAGIMAFSSEIIGLEKLLPDRDRKKDYQPVSNEIVILKPSNNGMEIHSQYQPESFF